jgi:hypothetical protein
MTVYNKPGRYETKVRWCHAVKYLTGIRSQELSKTMGHSVKIGRDPNQSLSGVFPLI